MTEKTTTANALIPDRLAKNRHQIARAFEYRIWRRDNRNMVIQRRNGKRWKTLCYCGNSAKSLAHGLMALGISQHDPEGDDLGQQLTDLRRHVTEVSRQLEVMIMDAKNRSAF